MLTLVKSAQSCISFLPKHCVCKPSEHCQYPVSSSVRLIPNNLVPFNRVRCRVATGSVRTGRCARRSQQHFPGGRNFVHNANRHWRRWHSITPLPQPFHLDLITELDWNGGGVAKGQRWCPPPLTPPAMHKSGQLAHDISALGFCSWQLSVANFTRIASRPACKNVHVWLPRDTPLQLYNLTKNVP